jgi:hypothetical protein
MHVRSATVVGECPADYQLSKKAHSKEFLREVLKPAIRSHSSTSVSTMEYPSA